MQRPDNKFVSDIPEPLIYSLGRYYNLSDIFQTKPIHYFPTSVPKKESSEVNR